MISIGKKIQFQAFDEKGFEYSQKTYLGRWLLLYFYPKDDTPGCTKEACAIRDSWKEFKEANISVLGVSIQNATSHQKFREKYQIPFPLLVDEDRKLVEMFGAWRKKKFMGREYMGTERISFLINTEGKIQKIYEKIKPEEHASEILRDVLSYQ
ncbi:MAG: thioredoxin-dependent thiol peroxidase [Candidatus Moraniibacteriota bacterium]|nr:MAG: thioredoxin-dependent thiol peroxidase [Candidatus Moranbacteria bacterium]